MRARSIRFLLLALLIAVPAATLTSSELHKAARTGNVSRIKSVLKKTPALLDEPDSLGRTPLHIAVIHRRPSAVKMLLDRKAARDLRDSDGMTPLDHAVTAGDAAMTALLLKGGASVDGAIDMGTTPLHRAIEAPAIARLLLAAGARVDIPDERGSSVVHLVAGRGDIELLAALLERKPEIDLKDGSWNTPLHVAVAAQHPAIVALLLEHHADPNRVNALFGVTPLHIALRSVNRPIAAMLLEAGARSDIGDAEGATPLHLVVRAGEGELAELLLRHGALINARDSAGSTPLHLAAGLGLKGIASMLLARGAAIDAHDTAGRTPLHTAIIVERDQSGRADEWDLQVRDRSQVVRILLERRAPVNARDNRGRSALHWAAGQGDRDLVELLIGYGADPDIEAEDELTPLSLAIHNGHPAVAEYIREQGGDE